MSRELGAAEEARAVASTGSRYWSPWLLVFAAVWLVGLLVLSPEPTRAVREHGVLVLVGMLGAIVGNTTAVGGGLVFLPFMLLFYRLDAVESLALALTTQAFGMSSGAIAWFGGLRSGSRGLRAPWLDRRLLWFALAGVAAGVALVVGVAPPRPGPVKLLFGLVSVGIGVLLLVLPRDRTALTTLSRGVLASVFVVTVAGTVVTGWAAIGVGEVVAAWLILRYSWRADSAVALGVALLAVASVAFALVQWLHFDHVRWDLGSFLILGAVFGARLGPWVARRLGARALEITFAGVAIADGLLVLMVWLGWLLPR